MNMTQEEKGKKLEKVKVWQNYRDQNPALTAKKRSRAEVFVGQWRHHNNTISQYYFLYHIKDRYPHP